MRITNTRFDQSIAAAISVGVVFAGVLTIANTPSPEFDLGALGNGGWQSTYESTFERENVIKSEAVQAYNALQYLIAGQLQSGVIIGKNKWLFSETEFKVNNDFAEALSANIETVAQTSAKIEAMGSHVIVALIPDKARVMSDMNTQYRGPLVQGRYDKIVTGLSDQGVLVVPALSSLSQQAQTSQVFLRTDTHWTPEGAIAAASQISDQIGRHDQNKNLVQTGMREHHGDLYRFLDLGTYRSLLGFDYETVSEYALVSDGSSLEAGLFGGADDQATIHLVGTSYSEDERWSFADALEAETGMGVINFAQKGYGPLKPMDDYLSKLDDSIEVPAIVIWEIPEKYMSLVPSHMGERPDA